jgi:hypothetical protein
MSFDYSSRFKPINQIVMKTMVINGGNDEKGTEKVLDFFTVMAEHQLLKYAAGKQMFCPKCDVIMDYRKTVIITGTDDKSLTLCQKCFDSEPVQAVLEKNKASIKEIVKFRKA